MTFCAVVRTIAARNGLCADFSPKPLPNFAGSGLHINMSVRGEVGGFDPMPYVIAGVLDKIYDMTAFLNPCEASYARLGSFKAPRYITWSSENRSQLIRIRRPRASSAAPSSAPRTRWRTPTSPSPCSYTRGCTG